MRKIPELPELIKILNKTFEGLDASNEEIFELANNLLSKSSYSNKIDLTPVTMTMGELFDLYELNEIGEKDINGIYIETPGGLAPINTLIKKQSEPIIRIETNEASIKVADKHLFPQLNGTNVFAKDADKVIINGKEVEIINKENLPPEELYDISIPYPHLYYTKNGMLHHNSALLVADAANMLLRGENVLFITLEMPEYEIARRIDANLLNVEANKLGSLGKEEYIRKLEEINKHCGKLIIKEYSAGTFNTIKLKSLMDELESDGFRPSVICIDYITLMSSSRTTLAKIGGTYSYYKLIAEELHGFAKAEDLVILTAAQLNRGSYDNLEAGLDSIADSLGVIQTADTVLAILTNGQLREMNQAVLKFLKNRNTGQLSSHLVETSFGTMRFTDLDDSFDKQKTSMENINSEVMAKATQLATGKSTETVDTSVMNF